MHVMACLHHKVAPRKLIFLGSSGCGAVYLPSTPYVQTYVCRLGSVADPLFIDAWYKAMTRAMPQCDLQAAATALAAAATWSGGASTVTVVSPPAKFIVTLLPQTQVRLPRPCT